MQVHEIAYRRIFNLGNYESAQVEFRATVQPDEDPKAVIDQLAMEAKAWRKSKDEAQKA